MTTVIDLKRLLEKYNSVLSANEPSTVSIVTSRAELLTTLRTIMAELNQCVQIASTAYNRAKIDHERDMRTLAPVIGTADGWHQRNGKKTITHPIRINPQPTTMPYTGMAAITPSIGLECTFINSFDDVKQSGELYYIPRADHFAIRIAGILFHGNIGKIYTDDRNPEKIKDCKFSSACIKQEKCDYYHDPLVFENSRDHRNFIANSWLYVPGNTVRTRGRRFGSRDNLDADLPAMTGEMCAMTCDQVMHDILCAIVLSRAVTK